MKAKLITFGELEIGGQRYDHDVVIDGGKIHKRAKKASKVYREAYGHTPLSLQEKLPWGGRELIVGRDVWSIASHAGGGAGSGAAEGRTGGRADGGSLPLVGEPQGRGRTRSAARDVLRVGKGSLRSGTVAGAYHSRCGSALDSRACGWQAEEHRTNGVIVSRKHRYPPWPDHIDDRNAMNAALDLRPSILNVRFPASVLPYLYRRGVMQKSYNHLVRL
jgi:hypothetical protein